MTASGFALVIAAAFCHATWNFFVKRINGGPELVWLVSAASALLFLPAAIYVLATEDHAPGLWQGVFLFGTAVLHLAYFLLLQRGYRAGDLSLVYPTARATGPLISTSLAVLLLGEHMTPQIALGGLAVIVGVLCLTRSGRRRSGNVAASLLFGLSAGVLIGLYTVWDAYAVSALKVSPLLLDYASCFASAIVLAPIALRYKTRVADHWRDHRAGVIAIGVFNPLAYILVLFALTFTPVVYVAPLREVSVLITVALGVAVLKEGAAMHRLIWAAIILIGIALLSTA